MIITIMVLIPYELRHFSKVCARICRSSILFYLRGGGGKDVEMCLTFHLLTSLCMQTTKALKRLHNFAFEQATQADICSIVFMKEKLFLMFFILY